MRLLPFAAVLIHALAWTAAGASTPFPNKPVTLVVGYPAGGTTDIVARRWGEELARKLGQPVLVENVAGAGGALAARRVARAPADGYTLLVGSVNELVLTPLALKTPNYKSSDFRAVMLTYASPVVLLSNNQRPYKSIADIVGAGRKGQQISYGTPGRGTFHNVVLHLLAQRNGIEMLHIPYKGGAPFVTDAIGGQIDLIVSPVVSALPIINAGQLRPIAITSAARSEALPQVPTFSESMPALQGFDYTVWAGIFAPAGTPAPVIDRLNGALREAYQTEALQAFVRTSGASIPSAGLDPWSAQRFVEAEERKYRAIVPQLKLED
ncbi:Bug family tripartite tricarboxylate transporter substrate binding protein [Variovorax terrae]|uniref:Tripartite tricarboxylate transporter substrate binding protein n=1 Tax=Variovorax terrae TaxID=2923278 RepID=A0A9X1VWQ1_9BURK|nr:tripartite tricarboxylate transporter substrate binding protein [Variovorax terrae]MCJ0763469.1 tripartite tricarboxylate transporter substrate binding protein [Variovorax terrae]